MNKFFAMYKDPKKRMKAVLIPVAVLMFLSVIFFGNELLQNSIYYLRNEQQQQQKYNDLLARHLDDMNQDGATDEELVKYLEGYAQQSGNSWVYLVKDEKVIFARDDATTDTLGERKDYGTLLNDYSAQGAVITNVSFASNRYEVGIVSSKSYLLDRAKVIKHSIYIGIGFGFCTIVYLALVIVLASLWHNSDKENRKLRKEVIDLNLKIEGLWAQIKRDERSRESKPAKKRMYNADMVQTLLEKSEDPALHPLSIIIFKVNMNEKKLTRQQLLEMMQVVQDHLVENQLMAEVGRGEFAVLLYHTTKEEAMHLKEQIFDFWKNKENMRGVTVKAAVLGTEYETVSAGEVYERGLKELRRKEIKE